MISGTLAGKSSFAGCGSFKVKKKHKMATIKKSNTFRFITPGTLSPDSSTAEGNEESKSLPFNKSMALFAPLDNFLNMGEKAQKEKQTNGNRHTMF